jgi:hypothetical protein
MESQTHPGDVKHYLEALSSTGFLGNASTPESFDYMVAYYRGRAGNKRLGFRITSVALIILSSALPVIAGYGQLFTFRGYVRENLVLAVVSALVAVLAGLNNHFRWEVGWKSQTEALFALQALKAEWDAAVAKAEVSPGAERVAELDAAFERFRTRTFEVVHAEMGDFFKVQQAPSPKLPAH